MKYVNMSNPKGILAFKDETRPTKQEVLDCEHPVIHHAYGIDGD
jgi:hypothetical protein